MQSITLRYSGSTVEELSFDKTSYKIRSFEDLVAGLVVYLMLVAFIAVETQVTMQRYTVRTLRLER